MQQTSLSTILYAHGLLPYGMHLEEKLLSQMAQAPSTYLDITLLPEVVNHLHSNQQQFLHILINNLIFLSLIRNGNFCCNLQYPNNWWEENSYKTFFPILLFFSVNSFTSFGLSFPICLLFRVYTLYCSQFQKKYFQHSITIVFGVSLGRWLNTNFLKTFYLEKW